MPIKPLVARLAHESHRVATPLELFFDLVFVVAIAEGAGELHHAISANHVGDAVWGYAFVFFAIWWAWMNFTWFASAYDNDDIPYRLTVFVQMTGALVLAAGIPQMFDGTRFWPVVAAYVIMRLAMVAQWLRAAASDPPRRQTARRYAFGIAAVQVGWILWLLAPAPAVKTTFLALAAVELIIPAWAELPNRTTWHPHHIAERYGLFTIIVLGESILAATLSIQKALVEGETVLTLAPIIVGGLLIVFSMWWLYFYRPAHDLLDTLPHAFRWGYGHSVVFAAGAAVGAGLSVAVDYATHHAEIGSFGAGMAVAAPVAIFLLSLWFLHHRPGERQLAYLGPLAAGLVLLTPFTGIPVLLTGLILAGMLAIKLARGRSSIVG